MNQIITSGLGKINWRDLLHGLYVAIGSAVSLPLLQWVSELQTGKFTPIDFKAVAYTGAAAGVAYLVKKILTPAQIITPIEKV